jgi:DNA-binding transcriptional regulator YbjK
MTQDKETKDRLMACAKEEFIEKGYNKASLRNICKNAGVTTGALYFFFKDKDDLFISIAKEPLDELKAVISDHFSSEALVPIKGIDFSREDFLEDFAAAYSVLECLYKYKDEFDVILNKAQGSSLEGVVDSYVDYLYDHYLKLFCGMKGYKSSKELTDEDRFIVHFMSHDQVDVFTHILAHCKDLNEAKKQMKGMFEYMIGGWMAVIKGII